jgi:barrier-to-autointegration factor
MTSLSAKHRVFVSEPMGKKDVTEIAGIGEQLGSRLKGQGYEKVSRQLSVVVTWFSFQWKCCFSLPQANSMLGQFLVMKKDKPMFTNWMKDTVDATSEEAEAIYSCLLEWCGNFLS